MRNLSTQPVGLLGLLGIKNEGQYPGEMGGTIAPILDQLPWFAAYYGRENILEQPAAFSTTGTKGGAGTVTTCPEGQVWLVHGCNYSVTLTATDMLVASVAVMRALSVGATAVRQGDVVRSSATDAAGVALVQSVIPGPFLMYPGDRLAAVVHKITTAGTIQGFLSAMILRFPT